MPHNHKPELIELLINEAINDQQVNNPANYVAVKNRARPQGFAEHFSLLLEDTPTIHSSIEPEFFLHFFLGSILTLPNTELMFKLNIAEILFKLDKDNFESVKLVFKIHNQNGYKLKFIIINSGAEQNIGFTNEELSEVKSQLSDSNIISLEGQILHIVKDKGFKLKILPELSPKSFTTVPALSSNVESSFHKVIKDIGQDFDPLLAQLSKDDIPSVLSNTKDIFVLLKEIYKSYSSEVLGESESSYHGYIYGFFRLNYKYKYALDCYVERIAGKGYADLVLLSRNNDKGDNNQQTHNVVASQKNQNQATEDKKQFIPIIVELKAGAGAYKAIKQIHESGYIYNLPNIRTNANDAVIVGVDFTTNGLIVKSAIIEKFTTSLIYELVKDIQNLNKVTLDEIKGNIEQNIKHLYYSSMKSKDTNYLSRVLLGQSISLQEQNIQKYVFEYSDIITEGTLTTIVFKNHDQGIILNVVEKENNHELILHNQASDSTRSKITDVFSDDRILDIERLSVKDVVIATIEINTKAQVFADYITSDAIKVTKKTLNQFIPATKYQGKLQEISTVSVDNIINSIYVSNVELGYETDVEDMTPSVKKRKLDGNAQDKCMSVDKLLSKALLSVQKFISKESDLQALMQGLFIGQRYGEEQIKVFSEISYGHGRADLALFFFDTDLKEGKPIIFELKYLRSSVKWSKNAVLASKLQLVNYINYFKSSSDTQKVEAVSIIYKKYKGNNFLRVYKFTSKVEHTSHSSSADHGKIADGNYKQEAEISVIESILSHNSRYEVLDFSNYHLSPNDYIKLIMFLNTPRVEFSYLSTINLSNNDIDNSKSILLADMLSNNVFINKLDLSNNQIDNLSINRLMSALINKENIRALERESYRKIVEEILNRNNGKYYLTSLDLSNNKIDFQGAKYLGAGLSLLDGVEQLKLSNNNIGDKGLEAIAKGLKYNYALQVLDLSNIKCSINGCITLASRIREKPSIVELNFANNNVGLKGIINIIDALGTKNSIQILNLAGNNRQPIYLDIGQDLANLAHLIIKLTNLRSLNFADNAIGNIGLALLVDALKKSRITSLDLSNNNISDIASLCSFLEKHKILERLILQGNTISNLTPLLELLKSNTKLNYLDLKENLFTAVDAQNLFANLINYKVLLNHLDLSGTDLSKKAQDDFIISDSLDCLIKNSKHLESLILSKCNINDRVAKIIFDSLELNSRLKYLDLSYNQITINNAEVILGKKEIISRKKSSNQDYKSTGFLIYNDKLEELNLAHNSITDKGGKILIKLLALRGSEEVSKVRKTRGATINLNLDLSHNKFTEEFVKSLSEEIATLPINSLKLRDNNFDYFFTNQLINAIEGDIYITHLDLFGNDIFIDDKTRLNHYLIRNKVAQIVDMDNADSIKSEGSIVSNCLPGTSKGKRSISINECKIGWSDVDEISISKTRNREEIIIDSKKFLAYSKKNIGDEQKSWQLVRLAQEIKNQGVQKVVGEYKGLFDSVIEAGGYKNYLQQERIKDIGLSVINRDEHNISPELKLKLINAAGKVQLIRGMHSTIVSCQDGESTNSCALSVSGLGYSFLSQPIENMMVKVAPKMVGNAVDVTSKLAPKILSYDTKFILQTLGVKYGVKIAKGGAGAIASIFDIADIGMASNILIECNKRVDSNPCSDKEIRDNIASITFSSISFISGVALTVVGAGPAAIVVGAIIMVGQGIYNGISNIIEYEKKYDTTHGENWSIFWRTFLLQRMSEDIEHLSTRDYSVNEITQYAWQRLNNYSEYIVAYAVGLGKAEVRSFSECRDRVYGASYPVTGANVIGPYCKEYSYYNIRSAYSKIDMSSHSAANTHKLSRILPNPIKNATLICLPKITDADYEKGIVQSRPNAIYECDNAVVMVNNHRKDLSVKEKYIVYDLRYVNSGTIIGSQELNNIFEIFGGNALIFGSSSVTNIFMVLDDKYHGQVYLDNNSTNIIDVRKLPNDLISMEYTHVYPLTMNISITANNARISQVYSKSKDNEIRYIGRENKVDKIICKQLLYRNHKIVNDNEVEHNHIVIDSGGGENYTKTDKIQNCTKLIMSPNTVVQGASGNYTIYVKSLIDARHNKEKYAFSSINVRQGTIIFTDLSLLKDSNHIVYLEKKNILSFNFSLRDGGTYTLWLENYFNKDDNTNYVLIDKYGSNIVYQHILSNTTIRHFGLYAECNFDTVEDVVKHYRNISHSKEDYAVFSTVKNTQYNSFLKFGSSERDIIIIDKDVVYVDGGNGSDLYIIDNNIDYPINVNNKAEDLQLDVLKLPVNNIILIEDTNNLHLLFNKRDEVEDTKYQGIQQEIIIENYFEGKIYQHIAIMDRNNNSYIPYNQNDAKTLLPFYHASFGRNIFILSPNTNSKAVVIDIDVNNIMLHKQGSDLLLTEKKASSFNGLNIILRDYYKDQKQWLAMKLYSYNNGDISNIIDLNNIQISAISYQGQYDNVIKEYVVDLTNRSDYIEHNHDSYYNGKLGSYHVEVESKNEKIGVVIFKNTPFKRLRVVDHENHIFRDKLYDDEYHSLIIGYWKTNSKYQMSMFEFDTGLNQERIPVLNDTIARIALNNELDREIKKIDIKVVKAVIDFLKLSCTKYNEQGNLSEELRYNFLEEELSYRIGDSNNQAYSLEEVKKYLSSGNDIAGAGLLWLMFKSYNELLIKYPYIRSKDLHKIDDSCFETVISCSKSKIMIDNLNDSTSFSKIEHNINQFINSNKQEVQQVITHLAELYSTNIVDIAQNSHHKHRHHHGESTNEAEHHVANKHIRGYHRVRRDIEEELQIAKDGNDNNDGIGVSVGDVAVMSGSSGSSFKPIGYNIIKWIKDNICASINLNPIERVKNLLNIDDVKEKVEIYDVDVSDNVEYGNNDNQIRSIEAKIIELEERKLVEKKLLSKLKQKLKIIEEECRYRSDEQKEYEEELSSRLSTLTKRKVDIQKQYAAADQIVIIEEINNEMARIKQSIEENEQLNSNYFCEIAILKAKVLRGDITELCYEDSKKDLTRKIKDYEEEDIRLTNVLEELEKQQEKYYKLGSILGQRLLREIEEINIEKKKILQEEEALANMYSNIQDQAQQVYRLKDQIKLQESKVESLNNKLNVLNDNLATLDTRDSNLSWHEELSYWNETVDVKNDTVAQVLSWVNSSSINLTNGFIGNNTDQDQVFDYSSLDFQGNLLLFNLLMHKKNGVKYNSPEAMIESREVDTEYAQSLAYNAYAAYRAENEADIELLGAS